MENLGHEIGHSLYTAAHNLWTIPIAISSKDMGMLWYH